MKNNPKSEKLTFLELINKYKKLKFLLYNEIMLRVEKERGTTKTFNRFTWSC